MEIVLSCNYKDAEQLQVLLVFITFEVTRMPNYESITLREDLHIRKIYSIHYFEYMKDYVLYSTGNLTIFGNLSSSTAVIFS